jgi:NAD(P)-dependent dehydrogenase (short-subunit alcohol dehydrogenase family)
MKVVLITGGARGIGAATARELAGRGWTTVLADIDATGDVIPLDVRDGEACDRAVKTVLERHGRLDAVWANAGIASFGPLALTDPEAWARTVDVNLVGAFRTVRSALPALIAARGYVAVTASLASFAHAPGMSAYSASKAGVEAMCNALRIELARHGVGVGTIHPTWIDTDMVRELDAEQLAYRRLRAAIRPPFRKTYPVERAARDIADGFDRRARRICTPGFVRAAHVLRAALTTRAFERDLVRAAPDIERLFAAQVAERGRLETSVSERVAERLP